MNKALKIIMATALMTGLSACGTTKKSASASASASAAVQMPNPCHAVNSLEEAERDVGFNMTIPDDYNGASEKDIYAFNDKTMIEVNYMNEDGTKALSIRKATYTDHVSGDYNEYKKIAAVTAGDKTVQAWENGDLVYSAEWTDGTYGYSVYADSGMSEDALITLVGQIG